LAKAIIVVAILALGNFLNVIDRNLTSLFMPVVREDIAMSDTQAGLVTGLAFVLVLAFTAIPIARLADRFGSRHVVSGALLVWSAATLATGSAASFVQLFAARMVVGAGEAGFTPAAHAALASLFTAKTLGRALAVFTSGLSVGLVLGIYIAGLFEAEFGWRGAFHVMGGAGIVWAAVTWLAWPYLVKAHSAERRAAPQTGAIVTLKSLFLIPAFGTIVIGAMLHAFSVNAVSQWLPTFLHDTYDMPIKDVGRWIGLVFNVASVVGSVGMGFVIDRFAPETKMRICMRWAWVSLAITVPLYLGGLLGGDAVSILIWAPAYLMGAVYYAPTYFVIQRLVPAENRAAANAVVLTTFMLAGLGLGPTLVGVGSDLLKSMDVARPLAVAMAIGALVNGLSAFFFRRAEKKLSAMPV
jgi:MFS family permease